MSKRDRKGTAKARMVKGLLLLLSLLIAVGLWFYVMTVQDPDTQRIIYGLPVTYVGEETLQTDRSLVIRSGKVSTVDVTVRGSITDLAKLEQMRKDIVVTCVLGSVNEPGTYVLDINVDLPSTMENVYALKINPKLITLTVVKNSKALIPIRVVLDLDKPADYIAGEPVTNPEMITVSGPEDVLAEIKEAVITVQKDDVTAGFSEILPFDLVSENNSIINNTDITCDTMTVMVTVPIFNTKSVPLSVELIEGGGLKKNNIEIKIDPAEVRLQGDPEALSQINSIELSPAIDLAELSTLTEEFTREIVIPNNLKNLSETTTATVTLKVVGASMHSIVVSDISVINVPDGLSAEVVPKTIEIKLRGPTESVQAILSSDIKVVVDLGNQDDRVSLGLFNAKATVTLKGYSSVAILDIDKYKVAVNITEAAEPTP